MKLTKKNVVKFLVRIQNEGDVKANSIATEAVKALGLIREHKKQTAFHN